MLVQAYRPWLRKQCKNVPWLFLMYWASYLQNILNVADRNRTYANQPGCWLADVGAVSNSDFGLLDQQKGPPTLAWKSESKDVTTLLSQVK